MKNCEHILKQHGLKITPTRVLLLSYLQNADSPVSCAEIYNALSPDHPKLSLSTLYRNLLTFCDAQIVTSVFEQNQKAFYQLQNHPHRHQMICRICHKSIPIEDCPLDALEEELSRQTGFVIESHRLEFRGLCPDCARKLGIHCKDAS